MNNFFRKYQWKLAWTGFALMLVVFVLIVLNYNIEHWFPTFLQSFGIALTLYPTVLIFVQSRKESDRSLQIQLEHLQKLNQDEINEMRHLFQKQMDEFKLGTNEQVQALYESTQKQIEHYAEQTEKIIGELNTNSQLLAEILLRQLEDGLEKAHKEVSRAEAAYRDLSGFKLLRSKPEREAQLIKQRGIIVRLKEWVNYLQSKCIELHNYLGYDEN
ncbi:MAG: hypothetical protein GC193_09695 [Cryomorphaceae bacterium]|nr:hypothetical protein [Cryomorphaceae bacterium]